MLQKLLQKSKQQGKKDSSDNDAVSEQERQKAIKKLEESLEDCC